MTDRELMRHAIAVIAYRGGKPLRNAPDTFAEFKLGEGGNTPLALVSHLADLMEWALTHLEGQPRFPNRKPTAWQPEVDRFYAALRALDTYLASDQPIQCDLERRVGVEGRGQIHARERAHELRALRLGHDRARRTLQAPHRGVGVDPDHEPIAHRARLLEILRVAAMQEIEHPVREHDALARGSPAIERRALLRIQRARSWRAAVHRADPRSDPRS